MKTQETKRKNPQLRPHLLYKMAAVLVLAFNMTITLPVLTSNVAPAATVLAAPAPPQDDIAADKPADKAKDKPQKVTPLPTAPVPQECPKGQCIINKYINPLITAISALVGVGVTVSIIYAGIQYASSADNPQKVAAARQRITTSVFVLIGYFVFYAFLNWLIPGGTGAI